MRICQIKTLSSYITVYYIQVCLPIHTQKSSRHPLKLIPNVRGTILLPAKPNLSQLAKTKVEPLTCLPTCIIWELSLPPSGSWIWAVDSQSLLISWSTIEPFKSFLLCGRYPTHASALLPKCFKFISFTNAFFSILH